jgi:hypothetical protein
MSNGYNFYLQRFPRGEETFNQLDIEDTFHCIYASFTGICEEGAIKNVYTEDFAENNGEKTYFPDNPVHEATDCELQLLFPSADCQIHEREFQEYIAGRKVEWYDTFRRRYVTLTFKNQPTLVSEKLYAGQGSYRLVKYKFRNIKGVSFAESQIE